MSIICFNRYYYKLFTTMLSKINSCQEGVCNFFCVQSLFNGVVFGIMGALGMKYEIWETSVSKLIQAFQQSLVALLPMMERVKIPWKDGNAYDDWDEICDVLFKNIVVNSLHCRLSDSKPLPPYGIRQDNYESKSFIGIEMQNVSHAAFVGFKSGEEPFNQLEVAILNKDFYCIEYRTIGFDNVCFFLYKNSNKDIEQVNMLEIEL